MQPIVEEPGSLIRKNKRQDAFSLAIQNAQASNMPGIQYTQNLDDLLNYANELITWTPRIPEDLRRTFDMPVHRYFSSSWIKSLSRVCRVRSAPRRGPKN